MIRLVLPCWRTGLVALILCALHGLASCSASAGTKEDVLGELHATLSKTDILCADFVQQRLLKALSRPLVSRGELTFERATGVRWSVKEPFADTMLITETEIFSLGADGSRTPMALGGNAVFRAMAQAILSLLSGDMADLSGAFDISADRDAERWSLGLVPTTPMVLKAISRIGVTGRGYIETMDIIEASGDLTRLEFSGMTSTNCARGQVK